MSLPRTMKSKRTLALLLLLALALFNCSLVCRAEDSDAEFSVEEASDGDELVQENPNYVEPAEDEKDDEVSDESDAHSEDEDDASDVEHMEEVKSILADAMASSRKVPRLTLKFVKKHRVKLTVAAAVYAFRREISGLFLFLFTTPKKIDPLTGKVVERSIDIKPTAIIKVFVAIDLLRKCTSGGDDPNASALGPQGSILYKLLRPANTAHIPPIEQHWTFERVNERYQKDDMAMQKAMESPNTDKISKMDVKESLRKMASSASTQQRDGSNEPRETVIVMDWTKLQTSLEQMDLLRDQVSFLLHHHRGKNKTLTEGAALLNTTSVNSTQPTTEVVVILESPGGAAADYGLAAQMILRLSHEPGMTVTVCVDKVAASGGYMIACASTPGRLYAAPFAVLGSIGVIGSTINVHNVLQGWGVKPLVFRGGKDKAPVGLIGEVTEEGVAKVQSMIDATHVAFKRHVVAARPVLAEKIEEIATGNVWLGYEALNAGLIDRVITSDEYIGERLLGGARVLRLIPHRKPRFFLSSPHGRPSLLYPIDAIRSSLRGVMMDFARTLSQVSAKVADETGRPSLCTEHGLTTAIAKLGVSPAQSGYKQAY